MFVYINTSVSKHPKGTRISFDRHGSNVFLPLRGTNNLLNKRQTQCEVFEGETCVEEFLDWLREQSKTDDPEEMRDVIAVAHNFQGYDSYFILEQFYKEYICPHQIVNGAKILSMQVGKRLKFNDSMCFLQMALASFVEAFGLKELKKVSFPTSSISKNIKTRSDPCSPKTIMIPRG